MLVLTGKALTAQNIFSDEIAIEGKFLLNVSGTWAGTITVQRQPKDFQKGGDHSGTHTGSDAASTLTDANQTNWTADQLIGLTIDNTTDGSRVEITDNTDTTVTGTLAGGTDNDWDNGDTYELWHDVDSGIITANGDYQGEELEEEVLYRVGFKTGDYTSGTAYVRVSQ